MTPRVTRLAALVLIAIVVAGCGPTASATPETHLITGTFTLNQDDDANRGNGQCQGTGGYSDIRAGLDVVVKNEAGTIVATSELHDGPTAYDSSTRGRCIFEISVSVPDASFYSIEVGSRGELTYSRDDMESMGWVVGFTLGD